MTSASLTSPAHGASSMMSRGSSPFSRARCLAAAALIALLACCGPYAPGLAQGSDQIEAEVARGGALDKIIEVGVVRIAVPSDLPPFGSRTAGGQFEGYDIDVARLLADALGVRLELVPVTSGDRIAALLTLRADLVVANLGVSPERAKSIAFSARETSGSLRSTSTHSSPGCKETCSTLWCDRTSHIKKKSASFGCTGRIEMVGRLSKTGRPSASAHIYTRVIY